MRWSVNFASFPRWIKRARRYLRKRREWRIKRDSVFSAAELRRLLEKKERRLR